VIRHDSCEQGNHSGEEGYSHGRPGEGVSTRHKQCKGPVRRAGNCGAVYFDEDFAFESSSPILDKRLGFNYFRGSTTEQSRTDILPPVLINLAGEILSVLRSRHEMKEKGQFEIRHSANGSGKPAHSRSGGAE
jgi:hypothetical protein